MNPKKAAWQALGQTLIKEFEKRNIEAYYFDTSAECTEFILQMMPAGSVVASGGSETYREIGLAERILAGDFRYIDRHTAKTPEEKRRVFADTVMADYYFMSSNAVTLQGELVNIDGNGNRIAALAQGPEYVMVICGMNKVVANVSEGISRTRNIAAPPNVQRLFCKTPCAVTGRCGDCQSEDCICAHTIVTRRSKAKGRIKVFLIGETLGY